MPVTAQAADWTKCDYSDSNVHIISSQVNNVDGKISVTIDVDFQQEDGYFTFYVFDKQLEKRQGDISESDFYPVTLTPGATTLEVKGETEGTYEIPNLTVDKAYYVYCCVFDRHHDDGEGGEDALYLHYAAYLGSVGSNSSSSSSSSSGGSSSGGSSSSSSSSGSASSGSSNVSTWTSIEESVATKIEEAPSGSTVVMENGITALSNSTMKELLAKGDVSLRMEFTYQDKEYVIIIPAGAALDNDIPWYGPLYLAQHFGNSAGTAGSVAGGTYEVKSGDSLSRIAAASNMTLQQLLAKNPQIKDPNKIVVGQKINR